MPLTLKTVPCLRDNYAYLIHDASSGRTAVVDVPEAAPIQRALAESGWVLSDILITHHHDDHIGGVADLRAATGATVWGARADQHRLPALDHLLEEGDRVTLGNESGTVIDVPGHTVGHIAFYFPDSGLAFTADSLMALGCGRLFEGSAAQMWDSLTKLMALPEDTLMCSGHDYIKGNGAFALSVDPDNLALQTRLAELEGARAEGKPMATVSLGVEKATNPFLRASLDYLKDRSGQRAATDLEMFAYLRDLKDRF
ncbi:hydroxyacylglutathione hydrolase [Roseinatronobacter bogoriensis]|uniref:Hydroxyacylglutathione hydrolase n=1 Tax=Roseinatronobacter bogoriensis subsp. barguzinensis TaxID=441209 RepID=A0A2K8KE94_9RHOB|nr:MULTISPECIES: hydroxyacylglutathione hydrolase [Rhodobaca]ATX66065.1 hydroxyacylglutathione hydrolase [Rhodobaca barguzinensis]MBB4207930.1 hydroxyacylglutathione hydrolase [Rhodobaca bogoriensis DSM 18756]TDW38569.1 hydroxyacylglutathione hydrolase [Rhodobaca barguzinensis]TDY69392.1 hydroxyacylglutathione hydrolase [Rhodobaca bogoriensis DSM 18756]